MDAAEALSKAEQFANTAYNVALEEIVVRTQGEIRAMRNKLAAEGSLLTGRNTAATVQLRAKCISELVQARLDALLEGYELYGVPLDDEREANIITKVLDLRDTQISNAKKAASGDASLFNPAVYCGMLDGECRVSHNSIKVQIERRRRMGKNKEPVPTNVYHVYGHNTRVNTNSTDQSVNVVTVSHDQIFGDLRQEITSRIPEGEEQKDILDRLLLLEQAQSSPSFGQRYSEFINSAANHMTLLAPFIPALTEILQKSLGH